MICEALTVKALTVKLTESLATTNNFCISYCDLWIVVCEALTEVLQLKLEAIFGISSYDPGIVTCEALTK